MTRFTYKNKYKIAEVIFIILFSILNFLFTSYIVGSGGIPILLVLMAATLFGFVAATFEVLLSRLIRHRITTIVYYFISLLIYVIIFTTALNYFKVSADITGEITFSKLIANINTDTFIENSKDLLLINVFSYLILLHLVREVRFKNVRGVMRFYYLSKAGQPTIEKRIIMFVDLKSSSKIAEQLGPKKYSKLIQQIYWILDEAVIESKGSIYQYVGDEIVISWTELKGLQNNNCLKCFFRIKKLLENYKNNFIKEFGIEPAFNGSIHFGEVAINEVGGVLKREIAFHGDVINTTSRICEVSKKTKHDLLISEKLFNNLHVKNNFNFTTLGGYNLKGKSREVVLLSVLDSNI